MGEGRERALIPRGTILVFGLVMVCLVAAGAWFYFVQERQIRRDVEADLTAVAQLKADQIVNWRAERLADARVIQESPFFSEEVAQWLKAPQPETTEQILERFRSLQTNYGYRDVLLVDDGGKVRLNLGDPLDSLHEDAARALATAFREKRAALSDLHAGPGDLPPHICSVAPLFNENGESAQPVGAVILQCDVRQFLFPLIESWPVDSRSAETILIRREDDSAVVLNELRHRKETALKLRFPLSEKDKLPVIAAHETPGLIYGKDYRGIEVLAVHRPVPDSPWFMEAKIDKTEALAAWRFRSVLILALILGLIAATAAGAGMVWQREQKARFKLLYEAEAVLARSEERYRMTLLSVGDGVITTDKAGRVELMNPVAERLTGWKQEQALGRPLEEAFHLVNEETRQEVENPVRRVVREGLVVGLANHSLLIARDGTEYAVADCGSPIRNEAGEISGVVLVFQDQTAEHEAHKALLGSKEALRESEEKYRNLVERANDGITIIQDGFVRYANLRLAEMWGGTAEEIIGTPFINYVHPGEVARVATFYRRRIAGEDIPPTYETVLKRKDGGKINAELNAGLITYQGRPADLVIIRDISERKRAEETLKAERHLFRTLMDNVPDAIYFKDAESRFVQINQAQAARFGLDDSSRAVGKTDFDFFTKEHAGPAYEDEQSILQSGEPIVDKEEKETWPDGHEGWVSTTKMPLRDHEGRIVGTFGVSHEITGRKRAEAALNRRMEELTALGQAARVLTASLDLNKVLAEIVSLASKVTASDYTSVLLVDESGRVVGKSADNLPSKQDISSRVRINGTTDWIIRSRRPAVIDDIDEEGFVSADMDGPQRHKANPALIEVGIKSYVGLPLMVKERLLGVLYFHSLTPHVFRDKLALLTAFANQAALALENARLYDAMQSELTERKRTEQALAEEGVRRRILIEQSRDGIVVLDENGKVYEANNKYAEMLGYTPEEARQLHIWDWDTQWTREQLLEMIRSVDIAGDHFETKHRRKDGTLLDVEISTNGAVFGGQKLVFCVCRDITQRKRDEENLKAALKERDVMLREIHHRVKNNIQIISSLLRLQSRNVRDENALEILNESQNRIKSIALIHEKLYQSQDFARIDFAGYIDKMITHLFAIYKAEPDRVQYKVEAENIHLDINRAIPCGLIINELITNALKHAFPKDKGGELYVRMGREDKDKYDLIVRDTGVGLPKDFDLRQTKTLGFQIIRDLVKQLGGSIEIRKDKGTEIIIRF